MVVYTIVSSDCGGTGRRGRPPTNPTQTATTKTKTETLERELFSRFGYPRVCLSNNGPQFGANHMRNAIERWGAEDWTTLVYYPRANPVERRNQEIKRSTRVTHRW